MLNAEVVNSLTGSLSGVISADYSPYDIDGDIYVEEGNILELKPGVELKFKDNTQFSVLGRLIAEGKPDSLIKLIGHENDEWLGLSFLNSDSSIMSYSYLSDINISTVNSLNQNASYQEIFNEDFNYPAAGGNGQNLLNIQPYEPFLFKMHNDMDSPQIYLDNSDGDYGLRMSASYGYFYFETPFIDNIDGGLQLEFDFYFSSNGNSNCDFSIQYRDFDPEEDWNEGWSSVVTIYNSSNSSNSNYFQSGNHTYSASLPSGGIYQYRLQYYSRYGAWNRLYALRIKNDQNNYINSAVLEPSASLEIINSTLDFSNSMVYETKGNIFYLKNSNPLFNHIVLEQVQNQASISIENSSIVFLNSIINFANNVSYPSNPAFNSQYSILNGLNINGVNNITNANPIFENEFGVLANFSPAIDSAHPDDYDNCLPPGKGTLAADMGMYGGMNNCGAQESNLGGGEPSITVVEDMPQDQGGFVGIQFSGSHYDGSSDVYDITHYSIWRELDTDGSSSIEAQPTPDGMYFRLNTRNTNAWEYIGDTPAQEFDNYGYTAPTIADSNHIGMFTSNFLVVAHTDDDDVFFVSSPMDGYSVDNIAPVEPVNVSFATFTYTTTLSWDAPLDEDYSYTEVRRNGEVLASGSSFNQFVDESLAPGESYNYDIIHIDENGNESRNVSRNVNAPEWYFQLTTQVENAGNSTFYFAGNDEASMGYDSGYDLPAPPAAPNQGVRMVSHNPSWENILGDDYSYISIGNVDFMNFNRSVDLEVHSDINGTVSVEVLPFGNLTALQNFAVYVNDVLMTDQMNGIYGGSFEMPVSNSAITYVTLVAGNPEGSDGFISVNGLDEISVFPGDTTLDLNVAFTSEVYDYDLVYSLSNSTEFPIIENIAYDSSGYDTLNIDLTELLLLVQASHIPNITFSVKGFSEDGITLGSDHTAQATVIGDTVGLSMIQPGWSLVHPYYSGDVIDDVIAGDLNGAYVAYDWNHDNQSYELINNTDKVAQSGSSFWIGNEAENELLFFGGEHPDLYDENVNTDGRMYIEHNAIPGWIMAGAGARPVEKDSIIVFLNEIDGDTVAYSWSEAASMGLTQNEIIIYNRTANGYYALSSATNIIQGMWIGVVGSSYVGTHTIGFEFPRHFIQQTGGREVTDLDYDWGFTLNNLAFGFSELASNEYDGFDVVSPPTPPGTDVYMRITHEDWNSPLGNSYLTDIRNSIGEDNIEEYSVKFFGTGDYQINAEHYNVPDSLIVSLHIGETSYDLTTNPQTVVTVTDGQIGTVSITQAGTLSNDIDATIPQVFALHQNYPNPFNPTTSISYDLPANEFVSINVFDLMGREVKTLVNKNQVAGFRSIQWNATNNLGQPVSAGMYIYTIQAGEFRQTRKMVLLK